MGEYFSHDYDTTQNSKIICLLGDYGGLGYGMYWRIIELLHQSKDYKLLNKQYVIEAIAKQMLTSAEQVSTFVKDCCNKYELFETDDVSFWSERVFENILYRKSISEARSIAGKAGAIAKQNLANVSKRKQRKGNRKEIERKENTNTPPSVAESVCNVEYTEDFIQFWSKYPRKVGKDCAYKSWVKAKPCIKDVLDALAWQVKLFDWTKEAGKFIPHPATYINQGRWKDEKAVNSGRSFIERNANLFTGGKDGRRHEESI